MKSPILYILGAIVVFSAGYLVGKRSNSPNPEVRPDLNGTHASSVTRTDAPAPEIQHTEESAEVKAPSSPKTSVVDFQQKLREAIREKNRLYNQIAQDPEARRALVAVNRKAVEQQYALFFKNAKLPYEVKQQVLAILANNLVDESEAYAIAANQMPNADEASVERLEIDIHKRQQSELAADLKKALGEKGWEQFDSYKSHEREWASLDKLSTRLSEANQGLTPDQIQKVSQYLIDNKARITSKLSQDPIASMLSADQARYYRELLAEDALAKRGAEINDKIQEAMKKIMPASSP